VVSGVSPENRKSALGGTPTSTREPRVLPSKRPEQWALRDFNGNNFAAFACPSQSENNGSGIGF
jgi:hypothetical protein